MANRPYFISINSDKSLFKEESCEFEYFTGFSISQKQKSINSLHREILKKYPAARILEVSRKSEHKIGTLLSAFNLTLKSKKDNKKGPKIETKIAQRIFSFFFEISCNFLSRNCLFF